MTSPLASTDVDTERIGRAGLITLNRPAALNALTLPMIRQLRAAFDAHVTDPAVQVIVLRSASPKAFCAGGDMRRIRELSLAGQFDEIASFFTEEYALDLAIAECPKPYVSLIDGIAMGGGLGLSVHGRHRVATEHAQMAMPETAIGFIPDVGASHFLSKLEPAIGMWLALTGARVKADEAVAIGLATQLTRRERLPELLAALTDASAGEVETVLQRFADTPATDTVLRALRQRATGFDAPDLDGVLAAWRAAEGDAALAAFSPAALRQTFALLNAARGKPLRECLALEFTASMIAARHADFIEGARAVLVDKDRNPRWQDLSEI
ncbi:MAG: enoyl-CoA hydratase/isomerase family protein [Burkholderiales bacterium]